jgi:hypothetical protein
MLVVSYGIFHKRRRKIMALIPSKARAGIAALPFAAAVAPFVFGDLGQGGPLFACTEEKEECDYES